MKIYTSVRETLAKNVINKWEEITNNLQKNIKQSQFLSVTRNGVPKNNNEKAKWSIRDAILNDKNVTKYIELNKSFVGISLEEKINKFNGYKFYQYIYLNGTDCSEKYLEIYAIFIGYKTFKDFVEISSGITPEDRNNQLAKINDYYSTESSLKKIELSKKINRNYDIPVHLLGQYEGYFIRPRMPKIASNELFSKLTLLLCDNSKVFVRTTNTQLVDSGLEKKYYEGVCYTTNSDTLHMSFSIEETDSNFFEFSFVFDIQSRRIKQNFNDNRHLYGIYAGSDITTKKPTAGRLIIKQIQNWTEQIKNKNNRNGIIEDFLNNEDYHPLDMKDELRELFEQKPDERNIIRDFFTVEKRYIEDINVIQQFIRSPQKYESIEGSYSIYTLSSSTLEVKRGVAHISSLGEITVKGSKISNEKRMFQGWVSILKNDILSITLSTQKDGKSIKDEEMIFYMLKLNARNSNGNYDIINGIRVMSTLDGDHLPFSGRVVFVREKNDFYENTNSLQTIKLFEDLENEELLKLNEFKKLYKGSIYNLLVGFENNIVKTFGNKREKIGYIRNINYAENFLILAKYHAKNKTNGDYELSIINLYYSYIHGRQNIYSEIEKDKDFSNFLNDKQVKDTIDFKEKIIEFDEIEIDRIKLTLRKFQTMKHQS